MNALTLLPIKIEVSVFELCGCGCASTAETYTATINGESKKLEFSHYGPPAYDGEEAETEENALLSELESLTSLPRELLEISYKFVFEED